MSSETRKPFHMKGFVSLLVTLSFLVAATTGVVLYASPKGRVAHWTGWTVAGLDKEEWSAVHMMACLIFLVAAGFHLYLNWATFWSYLKARATAGLNLKRELILSVVIVVLLVGGAIVGVPPFGLVVAGRDGIQQYWENRSAAAPAPHAELFPLSRIAADANLPVETALERLEAAGIAVEDPLETVEAIAKRSGKTPSELFGIIAPSQSRQGGGRGQGGQGGQGAGYGQMTVEQVCQRAGVDLDAGLARLREAGVTATGADRLKDLAQQSGRHPKQIADMLAGP